MYRHAEREGKEALSPDDGTNNVIISQLSTVRLPFLTQSNIESKQSEDIEGGQAAKGAKSGLVSKL